MRIAAYCRVSTEKDAQLDSLENQKRFFKEFAAAHGHQLVQIYADEGISGKQMKNRAAFLAMLQDARLGRFDLVLVKDISRFARNTVDFLNAVRELKSENIEVQFLSNNQTVLGNSEFVLTVFSALAQEESANLSKRVKFGKRVNAQKGRVPNAVYGYRKLDTFRLEIVPEEADVVRQIFQLYVTQGLGARKIGQVLEQRRLYPRSGEKWLPTTIRRMLKNPLYCGVLENHKYEIADFLTGRQVMLPQEERFVHQRPQLRIVSQELWLQAQTILQERARQYQSRAAAGSNPAGGRASAAHLFSTLIRCGSCGRACVRRRWRSSRKEHVYWLCSGFNNHGAACCPSNATVQEDWLQEALLGQFASIARGDPQFAKRVGEHLQRLKGQPQEPSEAERLEKEAARCLQKIEKYKQLYVNGFIPLQELKEHVAQNEQQRRRALAQRERIKRQEPDEAFLRLQGQDAARLIALAQWNNMDLKKLVDKIELSAGEIRVYWKKLE